MMIVRLYAITVITVVWLTLCSCLPYSAVQVESSGGKERYLVLNGVAKKIADDITLTTLGLKAESVESISADAFAKYKVGTDLPQLRYNDQSPDEITRVEIVKSLSVLGDIVHDIEYIGEYMNPAITKWQGRLLLMTGSNNGKANTKSTKQALLEFKWFNNSILPFHEAGKHLGIATTEVEILNKEVFGEDPRVVVLSPERFQVYYAYPFQALTRIGMVEVTLNYTTKSAEATLVHSNIHPVHQFNARHKNWAPFVDKTNEVLLVQNINPLLVVKPTPHTDGQLYAEIVSHEAAKEIYWPYGTLRGGTNAILLPDKDVYLAFFHSKGNLPGNYMSSYFMGAYTFSTSAPYKLLSISALPIMPWKFYTGVWSPMKTARIDYCFFPTSILLEGEQIFMSAGFQDHSGFVMRLKLVDVLSTLVSAKG